jgi:hypothetical protein
MSRGDANWTEANEIEHQAWTAFDQDFKAWRDSLPEDHIVHYMDTLEQFDAYWIAKGDAPVFAGLYEPTVLDG